MTWVSAPEGLPSGRKLDSAGRVESKYMLEPKPDILLNRYRDYRFIETLCDRTWVHGLEHARWVERKLEKERSCSGFGISEPFAIGLIGDRVQTRTSANGRTMLEYLVTKAEGPNPKAAVNICLQLCLGLLRIHEGLKKVHGCVNPFNIQIAPENKVRLWSVPTARLSVDRNASIRPDDEWEAAYRPPESHHLRSPKPTGDIYSVGVLLARLALGRPNFGRLAKHFPGPPKREELQLHKVSPRLSFIIIQCLQLDPQKRFQSVRELAAALDPESQAAKLDVRAAQSLQGLGIDLFRAGGHQEAYACWEQASQKDWLSTSIWNNIGVFKARQGKWTEAVFEFEKAYKLASCHPRVIENIACCQLHLNDERAATYWSLQAIEIKSWVPDPPPRKRASDRPDVSWLQRQKKALKEAGIADEAELAQEQADRDERAAKRRMAGLAEDSVPENLRESHFKERYQRPRVGKKDILAAQLRNWLAEPDFTRLLINEEKETTWGALRYPQSGSGPSGGGDEDWGPPGSGVPRNPRAPRRSYPEQRQFPGSS